LAKPSGHPFGGLAEKGQNKWNANDGIQNGHCLPHGRPGRDVPIANCGEHSLHCKRAMAKGGGCKCVLV
jgi:hypothetical protein